MRWVTGLLGILFPPRQLCCTEQRCVISYSSGTHWSPLNSQGILCPGTVIVWAENEWVIIWSKIMCIFLYNESEEWPGVLKCFSKPFLSKASNTLLRADSHFLFFLIFKRIFLGPSAPHRVENLSTFQRFVFRSVLDVECESALMLSSHQTRNNRVPHS